MISLIWLQYFQFDKVLIRYIYAKAINELGLNQEPVTNNNDNENIPIVSNCNIGPAPEIIYLDDAI